MSLAACSSSQAEVLRNQIRRRLANGETKEEIIASIEERFGDRVLGAPKNQGFGRLAWLGPIIILIVGLGIIWVYLRRYLARPRDDDGGKPATAGADVPDGRSARIARIEEELKGHRT